MRREVKIALAGLDPALGTAIRDARVAAGLSISAAASALGVDRSVVKCWECAASAPRVSDLPTIERVLRLKLRADAAGKVSHAVR